MFKIESLKEESHINPLETYSLVYETSNKKFTTFKFQGSEILNYVNEYFNELYANGVFFDMTRSEIRNIVVQFVILWSTFKTDKANYHRQTKLVQADIVQNVKMALKGKKIYLRQLKKNVVAYMFLKLYERLPSDIDKNTLHVLDFYLDEEQLNGIKDNWQEQPIVKHFGITEWDDFQGLVANGVLLATFVNSDEEIIKDAV